MNGRDTITSGKICGAAQDKADRNIDLWLRESLCCTYNDVLGEQIPAAWLALIDRNGSGG